MPLITNNSSLGNLFGGKIATLNFNYQPNSSPCSATLTIVSENNNYIEPELYSRVVLPILRIPMRVVEVQYNDDGNSKTLQIEMLDELSFLLDKRLILINGVHSTGIGGNQITSDGYPFIEYLGYPKTNWGQFAPTRSRVQITKYGVLLGSNRTTIEIDKPYQDKQGKLVFNPTTKSPSASLVYDANIRNVKAGSASVDIYDAFEGWLQNGEDIDTFSHSNEWGYTLTDFSSGMKALGISLSGLPSENADSYFFNNSGTIRSVLSSILSSLGLSFYVDPQSQTINVIGNRKITQINNEVRQLYNDNVNNLANNSGVTQGTFKKTLKDSVARRLVMNTTFDKINAPDKKDVENPDRPKRKTFYRVPFTDLEGAWDDYELDLLKKVAGIYLTDINRSLIDSYIFALSKYRDPLLWDGMDDELKIYGGQKKDQSTMIDKTEFEQANWQSTNSENNDEIPYWQTALITQTNFVTSPESLKNIIPGFDAEAVSGGYPNTRTVADENGNLTGGVFAAESPDRLEEWALNMLRLGFGDIHISRPMSELRTERYNFVDQTPYVVIGPYKADVKLSEISELAFIQNIADRADKKDLTVSDLYEWTNVTPKSGSESLLGFSNERPNADNDKYHFIAFFDISLYKNIFNFDVAKDLQKNLYVFNILNPDSSSNPEQYLLVANDWGFMMDKIEVTCEDLWRYWYIGQEDYPEVKDSEELIRDISDTRTFLYERISRAGDGDGGGNETPDIPISLKAIYTKDSSLSDNLFLNIEIDSVSIANLTNQQASAQISIENPGPFYEVSLDFYRPPKGSDFDINKGLSSISSSVGPDGITTNISYSSRKYQMIDRGFISKYNNNTKIGGPIFNSAPAFIKNK